MERWRLKDRQILIQAEDEDIRVGLWPELKAEISDMYGEDTLEEVWPDIRLVYPKRRRRSRWVQLEFPFDDERRPTEDDLWREAAEAFRASLPRPVARAVGRFHWGQWALLCACRDAPRFVELIRSNPVLAMLWILNEPEKFVTASVLHAVSGTPQRTLLEDLGADGRKSTLKILRRVSPASFDDHMNRLLGQIITDNGALCRLRHLPRIGRGVVTLAAWPEVLELCSPSLLLEVSSARDEVMEAGTASRLLDYLSNCEMLGVAPRSFSTRYEVEREAVRSSWALWERRRRGDQVKKRGKIDRDRPFPNPPFPGTETIEPITSMVELREEGNCQRNCLMSPGSSREYARKIATKRFYLYRVTWPERCTLLIGRSRQGQWQRLALLEALNGKPKRAAKKHVDRWLDSIQPDDVADSSFQVDRQNSNDES